MAEPPKEGNGPGPPGSSSHIPTSSRSSTISGDSRSEYSSSSQKKLSYSDKLKTNVRFDQRLKRNVLEIQLERSHKEADLNIGQEDLVRVFRTLGIEIESQVTGWQIQYKGAIAIISVWMASNVNIERFCKDVNIRVNEGVMTSHIRAAGKTSVKVTLIGLDFNTPDSFVFEYLSKFGKTISNTVLQ